MNEGCGVIVRHYLKYKWYHKTWKNHICGKLGYLCDNCKSYNKARAEALKEVKKKFNELQEFLICDMPSLIFPVDRITGTTLFREDYFDSAKEVEEYLRLHFKILNKQIAGLNNKAN